MDLCEQERKLKQNSNNIHSSIGLHFIIHHFLLDRFTLYVLSVG